MGLILLGQSARQPPPGGLELSAFRPDKACVNCMGSASYAFPSPTAIFTSRNDRTRYLETQLRTRDPTGPQSQTCTSQKSWPLRGTRLHILAGGLDSPLTRTRKDLSISGALPTTRPPRQPRPCALTQQRLHSAEVAKHSHGGTRLKARRPSRAPHPLGLPPWGCVGRAPPGRSCSLPLPAQLPFFRRRHTVECRMSSVDLGMSQEGTHVPPSQGGGLRRPS